MLLLDGKDARHARLVRALRDGDRRRQGDGGSAVEAAREFLGGIAVGGEGVGRGGEPGGVVDQAVEERASGAQPESALRIGEQMAGKALRFQAVQIALAVAGV